jgi:acetylornithine deacetylase/succinyl-diaminopimelate desuccinylase-like protein
MAAQWVRLRFSATLGEPVGQFGDPSLSTPAVVRYCRDLLRIDTSNPGSTEELAAAYVSDVLQRAGITCEILEPARGRCSVISRTAGVDRSLPPLIVHGHLDVVPAGEDGWIRDPFGGIEADGCLWGRGAIDLKSFCAMMLAVQVHLAKEGRRPRRDVIFSYLADEEMAGVLGARWIVENRPDLFQGALGALGEIGGFSVSTADGRRFYPIMVAGRGVLWLRIIARGVAGHAAFSDAVNPLIGLSALVSQIATLRTADPPPAAYVLLLDRLRALLGSDSADVLDGLGSFGSYARHGSYTGFVPTVMRTGTKVNVIPERVELIVDCRYVPGGRDSALRAVRGLLDPSMTVDVIAETNSIEWPASGEIVDACGKAVQSHDPNAEVIPYALAAGTDANILATLGIPGYGFTPMPLPAGFDYPAMFHAANERVPIESLVRGREVLSDLILMC